MTDLPNVPDRMPHGSDPSSDDFTRASQHLALIAGALAASVVIYAGVAWFFTSEAASAGFQPAGLPPAPKTALAVAGVALLMFAPLIERKVRDGGRGAPVEGAVTAFRIATLIGFALREAAAMFGLLIAILTGEPLWSFGLSIAALAAMAAAWPSRGKLEHFVRETGATAPS